MLGALGDGPKNIVKEFGQRSCERDSNRVVVSIGGIVFLNKTKTPPLAVIEIVSDDLTPDFEWGLRHFRDVKGDRGFSLRC